MRDAKRLRDILDAIQAIEDYEVTSYDQFLSENKTQDAVMYNLVVIGEAANRISSKFQEGHPDIPWSGLIGTRNVIVHGYDQIKIQIVWEIMQRELDGLKKAIKKALEE